MKVAAYIALHYGKDYLPYAIKSIIDQVDKLFVLYTARPSYGHTMRGTVCPETQRELYDICEAESKGKLYWHNVQHGYREGDHRNQIYGLVRNEYDILAVVDADEVWKPETFADALEYVKKGTVRNYGVKHDGWYHFWRSFNEYNQDGFCPIRFHNLRVNNNDQDISCPGTIYHFGYAQKLELMKYKWQIHGHQDELRKNWLNEIFEHYEKGKTFWLHPTSLQIWHETQIFNKDSMPDFLKQHPWFNLDRI